MVDVAVLLPSAPRILGEKQVINKGELSNSTDQLSLRHGLFGGEDKIRFL